MEIRTIDKMKIFLGGTTGIQPMVEVIYRVNGTKEKPVILPWDQPELREEKILRYLNSYTLIEDTRIAQ